MVPVNRDDNICCCYEILIDVGGAWCACVVVGSVDVTVDCAQSVGGDVWIDVGDVWIDVCDAWEDICDVDLLWSRLDTFLFCTCDGPLKYGFNESVDLCPDMAMIVLGSTPARDNDVIDVALIQWFVYRFGQTNFS